MLGNSKVMCIALLLFTDKRFCESVTHAKIRPDKNMNVTHAKAGLTKIRISHPC